MFLFLTLVAQPAPPPPPVTAGREGTPARARANLATYVTADDYPADAIRRAEEGTTGFRLEVGPDGRVTGCTVTASSGSAALDETTCRLMTTRPRFEAARDRQGRPTTAAVNARIRWSLPQRPVPDLLRSRLVIGPDGVARECRMEVQLGDVRQAREEPTCASPAPPPALVAALKAQSTRDETRVVHDTRLVRDAAAPLPNTASSTDRVVLRMVVRFQVEPGGRVSNCRVIDFVSLIGGAGTPQPCRTIRFVPTDGLAAPTEMRMITTFMLEGEGRVP